MSRLPALVLGIVGALAFAGCHLDASGLLAETVEGGLSPDSSLEPGSVPPSSGPRPEDASGEAAAESSASDDANATTEPGASDGPNDALAEAGDGSRDANDEATFDAGAESGTCSLPSGATMCCGVAPCTDSDGKCSAAGACAACQATCTNPKKHVCCAGKGGVVTCEAKPQDC